MSSIRIRLKHKDGVTRVRTLITHPMETGRRINNATGELVPTHFIKELLVEHNGKMVASCALAAGISKDPYFSIKFKGGDPGDIVTISWIDNLEKTDSAEVTIK